MNVVSFIIFINILVHGLALVDGRKNMKMSHGGLEAAPEEEAAAAEVLNPLNDEYEESLRAGGVRLPSPMPNPSRRQIPFPPPPPSQPPSQKYPVMAASKQLSPPRRLLCI
ncbi:unnamed protein product [Cuscuta europaea]|uniref:Uncharacterized protein n=1 Tax=Cuscuta europaea TaxID=41803 RepID=A0A9P0YKV1_CUSEU|nr:unnamed protein product [Cuscuta europaea]